ncbi:hypothetical protein JMUB6875_31830 [Nocardia sp. JMUB6875]
MLWGLSLAVAASFVLGTIAVGFHAGRHRDTDTAPGMVMNDEAEVDRAVATRFAPGEQYFRLPTGVLLYSVEFVNAFNVKATGIVWQRIPADLPADVGHGVMLPESEEVRGTEPAFSFDDHGDRIEFWTFHTVLRQTFDYRAYPLDRHAIWIRMHAADPYHKIQLVPDFKAFPPGRPAALLGIVPGFVYGDWRPEYTAFSLRHRDLGLTLDQAGLQQADLYYNLGVNRSPIGPTPGRLVPVLLLAVLLFLSLFVTTTEPERRTVSGFTTFAVIAFVITSTLVIAVNHNAVRAELGSVGFAYIESWYIALYTMTLLVATNATLLVTGGLSRMVRWRENLLPKLIYWPLFTGEMFLASLVFVGI